MFAGEGQTERHRNVDLCKTLESRIRTVENTVKPVISFSTSSFVPKNPVLHKGREFGLWFSHVGLCSNTTS